MNKIIIPTILAATILIAGVFAMMPVQKASTVHTSIGSQANIGLIICRAADTTADVDGAGADTANEQDDTYNIATNQCVIA